MSESKPSHVDLNTLKDVVLHEDTAALEQLLAELDDQDRNYLASRLPTDVRQRLFGLLSTAVAVDLIEHMESDLAAEIVEQMPTATAVEILTEMDSDEQADVLAELSASGAEAIIKDLPSEDAVDVLELMQYPENSAGGLMTKEYLSFSEGMTIRELLHNFDENSAEYTDYEIQYTYVTDATGLLKGVLRMRDIILSARGLPVESIMIQSPRTVSVHDNLKSLRSFFHEHDYLAVPAIDENGCLRGIVERAAVQQASAEEERSIFLKLSGIMGGEEYRSMPLGQRCLRRLSWLAPNIMLNIVAASIIALYQDTLQSVIALAVFLPIISDMSGCSGNQAVAVSIRELSLGLIRPSEFLRVVTKEGLVGLFNGAVLGILLGMAAYAWKQDVLLSGVIALALFLNTVLSVLLGGTVPLVMRRMRVDPALASGPILTTVTDMCGFFLVLSLASALLV